MSRTRSNQVDPIGSRAHTGAGAFFGCAIQAMILCIPVILMVSPYPPAARGGTATEPSTGFLTSPTTQVGSGRDRQPIPSGIGLREAQKRAHELYASEFAKHDEMSRQQLTRTLLLKAGEADDPVSRYALLDEARELALSSGDLAADLEAIDRMAADYEIDEFATKQGDFNRLAVRSTTAAAREKARQAGHDPSAERRSRQYWR